MLEDVPRKIMNELNAGIYAFNLEGEQGLYLNKFLLEPLVHLNKVYNVPFKEMLKRTIHQEDVGSVIRGYEFLKSNSKAIHVSLRRAQVHADSPFYWFINFLGLERTEGSSCLRVRGIQFDIDPKQKLDSSRISTLKSAGFEIDKDVLEHQFGKKGVEFIKLIVLGYSSDEVKRKLNVTEDEFDELLHSIKYELNFPAEWDRYFSNVLSYLLQ